METIKIVHAFERRADGKALGEWTFEFDVAAIRIDGKAVPADSMHYLCKEAVRNNGDAYSGAKTFAEARNAINTRIEKLKAGTMGSRSASVGTTAVERKAWSLAMRDILVSWNVKTVAKLADRADATDPDTKEAYVKVSKEGNVSFNADSMRAYVARHDGEKRYTKRAKIILAAESGDDTPDVEV